MPRLTALALALTLLLSACAERGALTLVPAGTATMGTEVSVMVATTRASGEGAEFTAARGEGVTYLDAKVSVPPAHRAGQIEWPGRKPDPARHFVTTGVRELGSRAAMRQEINRRLARLPADERDIVLFVHGFNTTFAEGLYRFAQTDHDFDLPGVPVHFSWSSAGNALGYAYDRDSSLAARDRLESLLSLAVGTDARRVVIIAHSMGAFLTMESLRQMARSRGGALPGKLGGVVLLSPDIDVDVFRAQAGAIRRLPQPFVIFASGKDRALAISAGLTGRRARLGSVTDLSAVEGLPISVLDTTAFAEGGFNHFTAASSPALIGLLRQLPELNRLLNADAAANQGGLFGARRIEILPPFVGPS